MKHLLRIVIIAVLLVTVGCKSAKTLTNTDANLKLNTKQLIKENTRQAAAFKTLSSKVKAVYSEGDNSKSVAINLRMEKDKAIWLNGPFSAARLLITPDNVGFYNKLDNTFFEGDYKLLSDFLGTELDFNKVQNLLLGEALFNLKDAKYVSSIYDEAYLVQPEQQKALFELFYIINPTYFKIMSQQLSQPKEERILQIDYLKYQDVAGQIIPEQIKINAVEARSETIIELEFKSVSLNENLNFPFKIPSGFNPIKLK
ncbi:deoxyuridine 5'-triphosphate nucleotidohydrolase [Formosa agariphila KMM 3901]|uniref:Deoxyuridine 5'-triphosphate nucleotidohydrolase n=1 Tax=Formosa agariphila (strain DSM 15362 / KCTC 12365 / LMG 23005 / KMM 3901 / M-2Alg 35-1) TaxID=1347342 RepID=T2KSC6_FORAG|nr:DUF4292 domain-containing protein [Formosa agariphila]CDF81184.1 deoxyuridine 5'-triphosphate nucleotidohydrolase [Formosa agariphila KMM 3901]